MQQIHLHIKTLMAQDTPPPSPSLIADLVDAVLKAPGMRVTSMEVVEVSEVSMITRRVKHVVGKSEVFSAKPHHYGATAKPGEEQ